MISKFTIELANKANINLSKCYIRNTDGRAVLWHAYQFPGCHKSGSALRSRVVWWLHTGEVIKGTKFNIHHKNNNRADDRFVNLEKLTHAEHLRRHNPLGLRLKGRICTYCNCAFLIEGWRIKDKHRGLFCSQECYHAQSRSTSHRSAISNGLKRAYAEGRR